MSGLTRLGELWGTIRQRCGEKIAGHVGRDAAAGVARSGGAVAPPFRKNSLAQKIYRNEKRFAPFFHLNFRPNHPDYVYGKIGRSRV